MIQLAETYVWGQNSVLKYLLTRRLSQDHLELFFSSIRSRGGNRNNPNAVQFKSAYRKCLIARVEPSMNSNCKPMECDLLATTGTADIHGVNEKNDRPTMLTDNAESAEHSYCGDYDSLSLYVENVVQYIAGSVVRQVSKKLTCIECLQVLLSGEDIEKEGLIKEKDVKGGLLNPSNDVVKLCKTAESVIRKNDNMLRKNTKNLMLKLQTEVYAMLPDHMFQKSDHLFTATEPGEKSHYASLMERIVKQYYTCRLHHFCRNTAQRERGQHVRQLYTKLILFKGQ